MNVVCFRRKNMLLRCSFALPMDLLLGSLVFLLMEAAILRGLLARRRTQQEEEIMLSKTFVGGALVGAAILAGSALTSSTPAAADMRVGVGMGDNGGFYGDTYYPRHRWHDQGDWRWHRPSMGLYVAPGPRCTVRVMRYYDARDGAWVTRRIRRC